MTVTIVIPTYNRAHWLGGAISSVLAQTHRDFMLVVADNGSTDATRSVVDGFADERVRYVRRPLNLELNEHYNVCIDEIGTEYFMIVPDDDALLPDAVETLLPVLRANSRAGIAHGRARIERDGEVVVESHDMTGLEASAIERGPDFIRRAVATSHRIHATTALYRTAAFKGLPLDARDYPATEFGHWLRLALDWDLAFVARTVAVVRIHGGSYTSANARVTSGGYVQDLPTLQNIHRVKLRFIAENRDRLAVPGALRREAGRALTEQLLNYAGHMTIPERRLGATARTLRACARVQPRIVLRAGTWRLLGASLLGPRLVGRIKRKGHSNLSEAVR